MQILMLSVKRRKRVRYAQLVLTAVVAFWSILFFGYAYANGNEQEKFPDHTFNSLPWNTAMNQPEAEKNDYPDKRKITPETVRLTINEYYIPQVSDLFAKGVDYFEWLNKLDDPYLNRYKVDIKVDPADERLKLFWKRQF
ncbi:MAG: hypothetical protein KJ893_04790 [Candidatus Omnitrophica bacterium]|nr:hypothetical protein [Candidatus Omnitrophota bacterium]MBU4479436.1 hypothetical protein [Candidatus Omnitrophota bacterium]MCG2703173.1 hypothetical protein [Candidatus Omnitrophota bacterium]